MRGSFWLGGFDNVSVDWDSRSRDEQNVATVSLAHVLVHTHIISGSLHENYHFLS
jgi:hypothetical protein